MNNTKRCFVWLALLIAIRLACRVAVYVSPDIQGTTAVILSVCCYVIMVLMAMQWTRVRYLGMMTGALMGIDLIGVATVICLDQWSLGALWFLAPHIGAVSVAAYLEDQLAGCEEILPDWVVLGIIAAIYGIIALIGMIGKCATRKKSPQAA